MKSTYKTIKTWRELDELISYCKETGMASLDFETNAYPVSHPDFLPTILGVSFQSGSGWVIPLAHKDSPFKKKWKKVFNHFSREIVTNPSIVKYFYNALFEYRIFMHYGHRPRGRVFDVMLMKYLLHEERPNDLKSLVDRLLPDFGGYDLPNQPSSKGSRENLVRFWSNVELDELSKYCSLDCDCTLRIGIYLESRLMETGMYRLFRNLYMPEVQLLSRTILEGVMVNRPYLEKLRTQYESELRQTYKAIMDLDEIQDFNDEYVQDKVDAYIEEIEDEIDDGGLTVRQIEAREEKISRMEAGDPKTKKEMKVFEDLNLSSPKQLAELLYNHPAGFEFNIIERSDAGAPSTSESTLLKLMTLYDSPFIPKLLQYRALKKMATTYVDGILDDHLTHKDTIHPSYLLHGTVTSRLSSRNPNFQNLPRSTTAAPIKKMFIAPEDFFFTESDLSQAELRYAAEVSGDPNMLQIFRAGQNIHVATAARVFNVDYNLLNKARKDDEHPDHLEMVKKHKAAKVLNFTIFYGAGPQKVAEFLTEKTGDRHTKDDAVRFIDQWFEAFPVTHKWIKRQHKLAIKNAEVKNLFGIKRRLPIFKDQSNKVYRPGEWNTGLRQAINSQIQGGSSNITQWIALKVREYVLDGKLPEYLRLVSTVHDSIEYYVHKNDIAWVAPIILNIARTLPGMEERLGATLKRVPMKASFEYGVNWGDMHRFDPDKDKDMDFPAKYKEEIKKYKT